MKDFNEFSEAELIEFIKREHLDNKKSIRAIAAELKTYPTRIWRFCNKHKIPVMTASESLKGGHETKRLKSPRKGVKMSEEDRVKLGEAQHKQWESRTPEQREEIRKKHRANFAARPDKEEFSRKGAVAIRKAADEGSKLEKYLIEFFKENQIDYIHHWKGLFGNSNLEADFYLPALSVIIEVDGPSHFAAIFSPATYAKQVEFDNKKNAAVLDAGSSIIRIQHTRTLYLRDYYAVCNKLGEVLQTIDNTLEIIDVHNL